MNYSELKSKFSERAVGVGWFLLNPKDTLEFIAEGVGYGLELGIVEGFLRDDNGAFEPRQEFSSTKYVTLSREEYESKTVEFVRSLEKEPELFFEVFFTEK